MSRAGVALALILALAAGLRLWGLHYGLPWLFYFHDEPQVVLRALRFGTGDFNPHFFIWPGTLLLTLAFLSYGVWFAAGLALGWWTGREGFAAAYFRDPTPFYLLARLQSVAFGVWTAWLAHGLGRAAYSPAVGLAAALGLAVNALAGHYAHLAHPVTAMTAFTVLGLWSAVRLATGGPPRELWIGAVAAGTGMAAQYHAALLAAPLGVAVLLRAVESPAGRGRWIARGLLAALLAAAAFVALVPFAVLDPRTFLGDLAWITAKTGGVARGPLDGLVAFTTECLRPALGTPLLVAGLAGMALALVRRTRADLVLLSYVIAYTVVASRAGSLNDRYAIPLVVPVLALGARAVAAALGRLPGAPRRERWAVPAAIALLALPVAVTLARTDLAMTRDDTRVQSLRWFESNVAAGERVVIDMQRFWNTSSPPLAENEARLRERLAEAGSGALSGGGHGAAYAEFYRYRLAHPRAPAYYLRSTDLGDSVRPLDAYRREGFGWFVVSGHALQLQGDRARAGDSTGLRFYRALDDSATRVAEFLPEAGRRLGPLVRVYRLDGAGAPR
jgi:hypothetical protein